jgi:hypothetical protein
MFAWRSLGYWSNAEPIQELRLQCYLGSDGTPHVGETGQAEQGWHELHPGPGPQTASFDDRGYAYPSIAGPVMARTECCTTFDLPIYHVYEADDLVWGQWFQELGQTFVATGDELDKIVCLVASPPDAFDVVVREGGPKGRQIGPASSFTSGSSMEWGIARWLPGEVPLTVGRTYYCGITSRSGKPFTMYMHSTGDVYPDGCAHYDGIAEPLSDLGLYISLQRDDMIRSPILDAEEDGWVRAAEGVHFRARSANIRVIYAHVWFPETPRHIDGVFRVYQVGGDGRLTRVGRDKQCYSYVQPGREHFVGAIYAKDEIPLVVGRRYYLEVIPKDESLPTDESQLPKRDLLVRIYGEKTAGMTPVIFNQHIAETTSHSIALAWEGTTDADTRIHYGLSRYRLDRTVRVKRGQQQAEIGGLPPATTVSFRIVTTTRAGGKFETPVYQARTLDAQGQPVSEPPLLPPPSHEFLEPPCIGFLNLAVMDRVIQPELPAERTGKRVHLRNAGFEYGLAGWETDDPDRVGWSGIASVGYAAGGWDIGFENDIGRQSFAQAVLYQRVKVTPGKSYLLSADFYTDQEGHGLAWHSRLQRGDVRIRLVCDPKGATDFRGHNSTQWFRTGGQWMRFAKKWRAESDTVTVGVGLFRWRDWPKVVALADDVSLVEVVE